jgi:acyl-CoA hydrolase
MKVTSRIPAYSETIMTEVVHPNDTNPMGMLQGGRLIQWMDIASAVCAQTHAGRIAVTKSIDQLTFKNPAKAGDIITINAKVTRTFSSSMEIKVKAFARKIITNETYPINEAYFTFVAIDDNAKPVEVPVLKPESTEEKKDYKSALERRNHRIQLKEKKKA